MRCEAALAAAAPAAVLSRSRLLMMFTLSLWQALVHSRTRMFELAAADAAVRTQVAGDVIQWRQALGNADCLRACSSPSATPTPTELLVALVLADRAGGPPGHYLCARRAVYGACGAAASPTQHHIDGASECCVLYLHLGAAPAGEARCQLSDGENTPPGDFMCACMACAAGKLDSQCMERAWSSSCGGEAPCRVNASAPASRRVGTVVNGMCVTRDGSSSEFEQLCTPGAAAPR